MRGLHSHQRRQPVEQPRLVIEALEEIADEAPIADLVLCQAQPFQPDLVSLGLEMGIDISLARGLEQRRSRARIVLGGRKLPLQL